LAASESPLDASIKQRLADTRTHLTTLEQAVAEFGDEFELAEFERAFLGEPAARLRVYPIQAGFLNVINGCVTTAKELCELEGWTPKGLEPTAVEALKALEAQGLMSPQALSALRDAYERRNEIEHDYVGAVARDVYAATLDVLRHAPSFLQDAALYMRQRG
jgi:hypothetical protein